MDEEIDLYILQEFPVKFRVHALAWGPDSSLKEAPRCISFCSASNDFTLRIYTSNAVDPYSEQVSS